MKVFIITEGGSSIGYGHITRCISLYQAFEEKHIKPLLIINGNETVKDLLRDKNYELFNWIKEPEKLFNLIKNADIAIVDSYLADISFYNHISETVKFPVYMDDIIRIDYPRGLVVNSTVYADELNYPVKQDVTYLLGSQYIPIRKEFWNVPNNDVRESIQTVMITFGGDDMRSMTPRVLEMLNENFPEFYKKVVIGKGFRNIPQIESLKNKKTELVYHPDAEGMKKLMIETDIAISAAGQTLYELARVGVPTIAISVADNQMNNVRGWQKAGFIEYAGRCEDMSISESVSSKINLLRPLNRRKEKSMVGKNNVDGLGASRIVNFVTKVKL